MKSCQKIRRFGDDVFELVGGHPMVAVNVRLVQNLFYTLYYSIFKQTALILILYIYSE
jgi:hypothetical protein